MYECLTCGASVYGVTAARKHAKQGHKTQREAFQAGQLHTLIQKENKMNDIIPSRVGHKGKETDNA